MKKRFTFALTLVLTAGLSWAQTGGASGQTTQADTNKSTKTPSADSKVALNPQPLPPGERKAGGDPASKVALNPQPLPPGAKSKTVSPADKVSLNPQPLPPKQGKTGTTSAESKVALNPQPLPPGAKSKTSAESKVALNPQPLPPGAHTAAKKKTTAAGKTVSMPAETNSPKQ